MNDIKQKIIGKLADMQSRNEAHIATLNDRVSLDSYRPLMRVSGEYEIWSDALQASLNEYEIVTIPPRCEPYYIDKQIVIPSNRRIEASGATIRQTPGCLLLMIRNSNTVDGTHRPVRGMPKNNNISIDGGRWEESRSKRGGYGSSGKYDNARSFHGVSTLFFFNNMENLTLTNLTFAHTAGFAVQTGDVCNAVFEHIRFDECYADGLHINGNTENLICRDIKGEVGDDLVALNMYDWQNSSVSFGPMKTVLCEDLELSESSRYKAMRIEPGRYLYDDGSEIDCSLTDAIIRNVRGIQTFKLYFQTPRYKLGNMPERGGAGSADNLFFEDIEIDLDSPIDRFREYIESDKVRGSFAAFELGANIGYISLENIDLKLYKDKYPYSYLVACGPKSVINNECEIFDPYLSSRVENLSLRNIRINGELAASVGNIVHEIVFDDINADGNSTASGEIAEIWIDGNRVK